MDTTMIEKLQAMKRNRRKKQLLSTLIQYSLTTLLIGLFLSSPLWLPSMCSSLKIFFLVSLPEIGALVFGPKPLFITCNAIIIFLVGDSKRSKSSLDTYEYVSRSISCLGLSTSGLEEPLVEEKREGSEEMEEGEGEEGGGDLEEMEGGCEELDGDVEKGLDELNMRVEDFIAKINMQRRLEARIMVFKSNFMDWKQVVS